MKTISYEWIVEYSDEFQDIQDTQHFATYKEARARADEGPIDGCTTVEVALTREDIGRPFGEKTYAYINPVTGLLPDHFENDRQVPAQYTREVREAASAGVK